MRLCNSYTEKIFKSGKKHIEIMGEFDYAHIYLILNTGANEDSEGKKGLSHVCEHFFLEVVTEKYGGCIVDQNFNCMGFTDYDYTVFKFVLSNTREHIDCLLNTINDYLTNCPVNSYKLKKCIYDVIRECETRKKDVERSLRINSFLTDDTVKYVPMGIPEHIKEISTEDIVRHIKQYYVNTNLIVLCDSNITNLNTDIPSMNNNIDEIEYKKKIFSVKSNDEKILKIMSNTNRDNYIKIYFKQKKRSFNEKEKAAGYLLELIMHYKICNILKVDTNSISPLFFKKKIINEEYFFYILYLGGYKKSIDKLEKYVSDIINVQITYNDLNKAQNTFYECLGDLGIINDSYIFNNIFHYLIYNEIPTVTSNQVNTLHNIIGTINLEKVMKLKNEIYTSDYKIILS